ncbi:GNAT family N-acetyltransferase [Agromyces archimandritae]|uniref:GNAT family N-acetyltransferase n=1 Tax=Agromyces archimandritae TaxID=2781962 RepID=A0A975INJ1_9MICO|nr:GNAT family N-acetyltransferase [Agromyces archimandritae]QTX04294.1 GNAT family N-acetyltransferase [Agromyces archimandritae]
MPVNPEAVARAGDRWIWIPDGAELVESDELLFVRYPWYRTPWQLQRMTTTRPVETVLDEGLARLREADPDATAVTAWVKLGAPEGLDEALLARGAAYDETVDVLGLDLREGLPDLEPGPAEVRPVASAADVGAARRIDLAAFGSAPHDAGADADARSARENAESCAAGRGGGFLARLGDEAVGAGGVTIDGDTARLWGAGVLPEARGRGVYRALLAERLAYGIRHGAALALVKGRIDTSAPTLRRAGFTAVGQERSYRLPLDAAT